METINVRLDQHDEELKRLERSIEHLDAKIEDTEKDIMKKVEQNQADIKQILKEQDDNSKAKTEKLFNSVDRLSEAQYQQTLIQKDIQHELSVNIRDFTKLADEMKENDKWKTRTIAGFVISLVLMIIGTFWKMLIPALIFIPFL